MWWVCSWGVGHVVGGVAGVWVMWLGVWVTWLDTAGGMA